MEANMDKLVVLKHFAPWCRACKRLGPRFDGLAKNPKYEDAPIIFAGLSVSENKKYVHSLGVVALPTLQFYANGEIVETFAAGPSKWKTVAPRIDKFIRRSTTEDMTIKPAGDAAEEGGGIKEEDKAPDEALVAAQKLLPILRGISYFAEMNEPDFQKALSKATFGTVEEGTVILREGDVGTKLFVIVEGEVEVCRRLAANDGTPRSKTDLGYVVNSLGAGTYFGERSLITREPIAASIRAVAPTKVFAFSKSAFEETSLLSGKSDEAARAAEKRRLDEIYGLGGEEEGGEEEGAPETEDAPALGVEGGSIIPLLVRFRLIRSIVQCFDYVASNRVDFGQESSRRRRNGYVRMLGATASAGFKDAFDLIDADGDGYITTPEVRRVVDSVLKGAAGEEFDRAIEGGAYADKRISRADFVGLMAESEIYSLLTATFQALDENDTGYVNAKNLDNVLSGVRGLISEDGKNVLTLGDKEVLIDYEQFSKMLLKDA